MKKLTIKTVEAQINQGKIECITDLKVGLVEIRNCTTNKRQFISVIPNTK